LAAFEQPRNDALVDGRSDARVLVAFRGEI